VQWEEMSAQLHIFVFLPQRRHPLVFTPLRMGLITGLEAVQNLKIFAYTVHQTPISW
jgi:hypothetical protein